MKCAECDYELWRIRPPGPCPECGTPFDVTRFKFRRRAVRFLCPHCDAAYQGLDADGLPSPREFRCSRCGGEVRLGEMAVEVAPRMRKKRVMQSAPPWPRRGEVGFFGAWIGTTGRALFSPTEAVRGLDGAGKTGDALWFSFCATAFAGALGVGAILLLGVGITVGGGPGAGLMSVGIMIASWLLGGAIAAAAYTLLVVPLWAGLAQGLLALTGKRRHGFGATLRCLWYAQGAMVVASPPCVGIYLLPVGALWTGLSGAMMVKETQGVSAWRAFAACITPPAIVLAGLLGVFIWLWGGAFSSGLASQRRAVTATGPSSLAGAMIAARDSGGEPPRHALDLVATGAIASWMLAANSPAPSLPDGRPIQALDGLASEQVQALAASLTDEQPFYVVGGVVFCHRGVDLRTADGDLWLAFDDPRQRPASPPQPAFVMHAFFVHRADGQQAMTIGAWDRVVAEQNALRAAAGLAPIPAIKDLPALPVALP